MEIRTLPVGQLNTNCYIVYEADRQAVVIDPGRPGAADSGRGGKGWRRVRAVLLTHVHFDHLLAAREVMNATGAELLVPAGDEPALTSPMRSLLSMFLPGCRYDLQADRLLADGDTVTAGQLTLTVMHTPGHTPGSSCYIGDGVIFSGDTLFAGGAGRIDFPGGDGAGHPAAPSKDWRRWRGITGFSPAMRRAPRFRRSGWEILMSTASLMNKFSEAS